MITSIVPTPISQSREYREAYAKSYLRTEDDAIASRVALEFVRQSRGLQQELMITCSVPLEKEMFISNTETGEVELDAVLATTEPRHDDGKYFTETELEEMAAQINENGSSLPDEEHETLEKLKAEYGSKPALLREALLKGKGVFKSIKAMVKDGKLWIKALLDKRYKRHVNKYTSLSIEATATHAGNGRLIKPKYVGFTFTNTPQLAGAAIAA